MAYSNVRYKGEKTRINTNELLLKFFQIIDSAMEGSYKEVLNAGQKTKNKKKFDLQK